MAHLKSYCTYCTSLLRGYASICNSCGDGWYCSPSCFEKDSEKHKECKEEDEQGNRYHLQYLSNSETQTMTFSEEGITMTYRGNMILPNPDVHVKKGDVLHWKFPDTRN